MAKTNCVFEPDVLNKRDIISYFKDLVDIGPLLEMDWKKEALLFRKKLQEAGWGQENIQDMMMIAYSKSRHLQTLPSMARLKGEWLEWLGTKGRIK